MVIGLLASLIASFFTRDATPVELTGCARSLFPASRASEGLFSVNFFGKLVVGVGFPCSTGNQL
jgi:hypothetical protein